VALVIERVSGVRYHPGHVWKILGAMDWTLQRPAKQARERDPKKVELWMKERWPAVKKRSAPASLDLLPGPATTRKVCCGGRPSGFNWSKMSI
jgi:hypothetical protein